MLARYRDGFSVGRPRLRAKVLSRRPPLGSQARPDVVSQPGADVLERLRVNAAKESTRRPRSHPTSPWLEYDRDDIHCHADKDNYEHSHLAWSAHDSWPHAGKGTRPYRTVGILRRFWVLYCESCDQAIDEFRQFVVCFPALDRTSVPRFGENRFCTSRESAAEIGDRTHVRVVAWKRDIRRYVRGRWLSH